jgi:hypothetical protein
VAVVDLTILLQLQQLHQEPTVVLVVVQQVQRNQQTKAVELVLLGKGQTAVMVQPQELLQIMDPVVAVEFLRLA